MAASIPFQLSSNESAFERQLLSYIQQFKRYEDKSNQLQALATVPLEDLRAIAQAKYDSSEKPLGASFSQISPSSVVKDILLLELMDWFKNEFFTWMNSPSCPRCKQSTKGIGSGVPTPTELASSASRVEIYTCTSCFSDNREVARFPRYNDPTVLLKTRTGRCGEWANCFALICRAAGFEVRHVHDHTDHVWVEVFSSGMMPNRWVHADPCENSYDNPLLYEVGWGKKLTYIIAVSQDDIQDVTPRYSKDFTKLLPRRNQVRETWLVSAIVKIRKQLQVSLTESRRAELLQRWIQEIVELVTPKQSNDIKESEKIGRESGSLAWRLARQETDGPSVVPPSQEFTWKIGEDSVVDGTFQLLYDSELDAYAVKNGTIAKRGWRNGVFSSSDVFRKEERDWKMVYLAPQENSKPRNSKICWKFTLDPGFSIEDVNISIKYSIFQSDARFRLEFSTEQLEMKTLLETNAGDRVFAWNSKSSTDSDWHSKLEKSKTFSVACELISGSGNDGWQKVQLFRQKITGANSLLTQNSIFKIECKVDPLDLVASKRALKLSIQQVGKIQGMLCNKGLMTLQLQEDKSEQWIRKMAGQLSGFTLILIIAGGFLLFWLLFIFAKRQIMRFTLRSHRGPHAPIGLDAKKSLRREILRRIEALPKITYEPHVLRDDVDQKFSQEGATKPCHYHRMKAVDDAKNLEISMLKRKLSKRHSFESLRSYFIVILTPQVDPRVVHQFCDLYEAARYNPKPFGEEEYKAFTLLLKQLRSAVITLQPKSSIRSPAKTKASSSAPQSSSNDDKSSASLSVPYIRRLSKKKWNTADSDEETALCHSSALHEVSIISSDKDESTVV
ncbi:Peptide-N(4)-(N-acetyl-beta-glucosaminyl)asparagine amidase [Orchesella cincta]|uniref:Peptide-N(4)-(N-acetyl-beta-glucosaminyl)asparagine amidase n=1 Tax=Orchesella cincta TaxID=48709 RepID=A0A1D2NKV9_ORCCI|nr:Peptide-N(4)-(N-acetyl-beta-glucosaminyl)asparagine amidase [Orchesella cincta]